MTGNEERRESIFIGIPCFGNPSAETFEDYIRFSFYLGRRYPEYDFFLGIKTKSEQFRARNAIIEAAYKMAADYCLMIDDDHVIDTSNSNSPSTKYEILRLLLRHFKANPKLAACGAIYYHRGGECRPVLMKKSLEGYLYYRDDELISDPGSDGFKKVDVQGGGFILLRMKAIDTISHPWFSPEHEYGTDIQICKKLSEAGWEIGTDVTCKIGHVLNKHMIVTEENRYMCFEDTQLSNEVNDLSFALSPILKKYSEDVLEYMGNPAMSTIYDMAGRGQKFNEENWGKFTDKREYYKAAGPHYLARSLVLYSTLLDKDRAKFCEYVLHSVRPNVLGSILDFGCGPGVITFEFLKQGHKMWFIDIPGVATYEFLKHRADKYGLSNNAMWEMPTEEKSIDIIIALDSIEHLNPDEVEDYISKFAFLLKEGGALITNYMVIRDDKNHEHIYQDRPGFLKMCARQKLWPTNICMFQKRSEL